MFQVTPGYGSNFATYLKGGAHHQQVVAHEDRIRSQVAPFTPQLSYLSGQLVGGELLIQNLTRLSGEAAVLEWVTVAVAQTTGASSGLSALDLDLVLYTDSLTQTPADGEIFALTSPDLPRILGVVHVYTGDFTEVGGQRFAGLPSAVRLVSGSGSSLIRAVLVARSEITLKSADALTVSLFARRD